MREVTMHKTNPANEHLKIEADAPGNGGASHEYRIAFDRRTMEIINFQNGPIRDYGVNGITHEVLLAIVIDRLQGFQRGRYSCRENALALTKLEEALFWLNSRTHDRMAQGVEGTSTPRASEGADLLDRHEHKIDKDTPVPDTVLGADIREIGAEDNADRMTEMLSVAELAKRTAREDGPTTSERPQPGVEPDLPGSDQ